MKLSERLRDFALGVAADFKSLESFAFAKQSAYPVFSLMPDSGRFAGDVDPLALTFATPFSPSPMLVPINGSVITDAGKFSHNNATGGGAAPALAEPVISLLAAMGRTGDEARYGVEFYVMRATAGEGTDGGAPIGRDGVSRSLVLANGSQAIYQAESWATFVAWVRVTSGSIHCQAERFQNGEPVDFGAPILPEDGWIHIRVIQQSPRGYNYSFPSLFAAPGTVVELACAAVFNGLVDPGMHKAPIATTPAGSNFAATMLNALDGKVDKVSGKGLSTNDLTGALLDKLNGIAAGATANSTDAQLRDRATHTGTQPISTVDGLQDALDARPSAVALMGASPSILIVDQLRRSVEAATGGRQTVLYTAKGQPSHMCVLPRFNCEDIAPGGELGTGTHPAFIFDGVAAQEIFVGAYLASEIAGEAVSRPAVDPRTTLSFDQSRALCQASGPGWDLMSNLDWAAISLWCKANGYEPLGNTNYGRHHTKRWETARRVDTLPPGEATGTARTLTGSGPASWAHDGTPAGIQDMVGNVWEWVSGMKTVNGRVWLAPDNGRLTESQFVDSGFNMPATRVFSSVSAAGASALVKQSLIAPASAYLAPQGFLYTILTGERLPLRGGNLNNSANAGLGALLLNITRAEGYSDFGFRPRFRAL